MDPRALGGDDEEVPGTPIREALSDLLRARGLSGTLVLADILACWQAAAGPEVAAHVRPVSLRGKELVVEVDQPAWATQVQLLAARLLSRLSEELGFVAVEQLKVRVERPGAG
ncbi:MAG: DUF721 domain-containing protein [Acidimicrobiales bacterium]